MKIEVDGVKYTIHFKHVVPVRDKQGKVVVMPADAGTMCAIHQGDCVHCGGDSPTGQIVECLLFGRSYLNPLDNFDKALGRKLSLGRALRAKPDTFGKDFRAKFWAEYRAAREQMGKVTA
jgi:hypothetical protein